MDSISMSNDPRAADEGDGSAVANQGAPSGAANQGAPSGAANHGRVRSAISVSAHLLTVGLSLYVVTVSFETYSLFSWHSTCMTMGSLALMSEAVMVISRDNVLSDYLGWRARVLAHWLLQALAGVSVLAGLAVAVAAKEGHDDPRHFSSAHANLGLAHLVLAAVSAAGGLAALCSGGLKRLARPAVLKLAHGALGTAAFATGAASLATGFSTRFFENAAGHASQVACTLVLAVAAILTLESAAKSVYYRSKSLCRK